MFRFKDMTQRVSQITNELLEHFYKFQTKPENAIKAQVYGSFVFDLLNQIIPNIFYVCINMKWDYSNTTE